jgi:hypothetical protein
MAILMALAAVRRYGLKMVPTRAGVEAATKRAQEAATAGQVRTVM